MSLPWIKICGITTIEAALAAASAGADAIGFVFADSPRRVTPERAFRLAAPVRGRLACCAVVRRTTQAQVNEILEVLRPDLLQADVDELARLELPRTLEVLPVASPRALPAGRDAEMLLVERPPAEDAAGWDEAALARLARRTRLVLAGGLDPRNVASLVQSIQPYGVDVSRGVEVAPGLKGHELIRRFVRAARAWQQAIAL